MVKTLLKVFGALVILVFLALIILPIIFKDSIIEKVKTETNKQLNAVVDFGDFDLSLIRSFPDFSFYIKDVKVSGIDTFKNVDLVKIGEFSTTLDIMSVIKGETFAIKSFGLEDAYIHVKVLKNGMANYDIAKESESTEVKEEESADESGDFNLKLKNYFLKNFNLIYDDKESATYAKIDNLNHEGKGDFTLDDFVLETQTDIEKLLVSYEGIPYINGASASSKFDIGINMPAFKFTFSDNNIKLNALELKFDGFVAMPNDDVDMDITFSAPRATFKDALSMIPAIYMQDFEDVKTNGNFSIAGMAKGTYNDNQLPAFDFRLRVENGSFQYPDLPKSASDIEVDLLIASSGGSEDNTIIDLKAFRMDLGGNPVSMNFYLKNPISDPDMKGNIQSQIEFESLSDVIPSSGETYTGSLTADLAFAGKMSALEEERFEDFKAEGNLILIDFTYDDKELGYPVKIKNAYVNFTPKAMNLTSFELLMKNSNILASGTLSNYLPYALHDETIYGNLALTSSYFNADEFSEEEVAESTETANTDSAAAEVYEVVEIPKNINFTTTVDFKKVIYDGMELENMNGKLSVKEGGAYLDNFAMNIMKGRMVMGGVYHTLNPQSPFFDFELAIEKFDAQEAFKNFNTVQKLAPIGESAKGTFSCNLTTNGNLDNFYEPIMNSLNGKGVLKTHTMELEGSDFINKAADILKNDNFRKVELNDLNVSFSFNDGRLDVAPFDVKISKSKATIKGSNYFDERIDYVIDMDIPTSEFGGAGAMAATALQGLFSQAGVNAPSTSNIKMALLVTGTVSEPIIKPRMSGENAKDDLKNQLKDELDKQKEALEKKAREEAEKAKEQAKEKINDEKAKLIKEADEKGQKLISEAEKQATNIRSQAKSSGDALIRSAQTESDKLVKYAGANPVKKKAAELAGNKLVKEAQAKADKLNSEADVQANNVVDKARKEAARLKAEAEAK